MRQFRQDVRNHINAAHGGHTITWQQYRNLADTQVVALLTAMGGVHIRERNRAFVPGA